MYHHIKIASKSSSFSQLQNKFACPNYQHSGVHLADEHSTKEYVSFNEERDITRFQPTKLNNEFLILSVTNISYSSICLKNLVVFPLVDVATFFWLKKKKKERKPQKNVPLTNVLGFFCCCSVSLVQMTFKSDIICTGYYNLTQVIHYLWKWQVKSNYT